MFMGYSGVNGLTGESSIKKTATSTPFGTVVSNAGSSGSNGTTGAQVRSNWTNTANTISQWSTGLLSSTLNNVLSTAGDGTSSSQMLAGVKAGNDAIATAQGGVDVAKDAQASVQSKITNTQNDLEAAKGAAKGMGTDIQGIRDAAAALDPYAQLMNAMGQELYQQGVNADGVGEAIRSGDASKGGVLGQYINNVMNAFSPDAYVSQAATDTQASYDNMLNQLMRSLSRSGANTSGGNAMQTKSDWAKTAAAAIAGAKTRSRLQGLKDQQTQLGNALQLALEYDKQSVSAKQQGMAGVESAAGIVEKKGDLLATASAQGAAQTSAYTNIAGVEVDLGNLEVNAAKNVQDAINNVTSAQQAMTSFYQSYSPTVEYSTNPYTGFVSEVKVAQKQ